MGEERTTILRIFLIGLTEIVIIAVSAAIGLLVAHWPECMSYLTGRP